MGCLATLFARAFRVYAEGIEQHRSGVAKRSLGNEGEHARKPRRGFTPAAVLRELACHPYAGYRERPIRDDGCEQR